MKCTLYCTMYTHGPINSGTVSTTKHFKTSSLLSTMNSLVPLIMLSTLLSSVFSQSFFTFRYRKNKNTAAHIKREVVAETSLMDAEEIVKVMLDAARRVEAIKVVSWDGVKEDVPWDGVKEDVPWDGVKEDVPWDGVKEDVPWDGVKEDVPWDGVKEDVPWDGVKEVETDLQSEVVEVHQRSVEDERESGAEEEVILNSNSGEEGASFGRWTRF